MAAKKERKPNDLFGTLNSINNKTPLLGGYDKKQVNAFILLKWLAHCPDIIHIVNRINKYQFGLPDELVYKTLYDLVPKRKRFVKWVKGKKDEETEKKIEELMQKYGISRREAQYSIRR